MLGQRLEPDRERWSATVAAAAFNKRTFVFNYRVFTLPQPHVNLAAPPQNPHPIRLRRKKKYLTHTVALALLTRVNRAMI